MSTDITSISGYNQQDYRELAAQYTERTGKTEAQLQETILQYVEAGKTFDEAIDLISNNLPTLEPPIYDQGFALYVGTVPASFGSAYLALIQDLAADQRKQAADAKALQTEVLIKNIEEQADNIRTKAALELTASVISGTMQIVSGFVAIGMSSTGLSNLREGLNGADGMLISSRIQGFTSGFGGAGQVGSSFFSFGGHIVEAKSKELEAEAERIRATQQQLDKIDEAMKELLQKARATQDAIQQNMNQTRSKILG